jgi:hypothetical protein
MKIAEIANILFQSFEFDSLCTKKLQASHFTDRKKCILFTPKTTVIIYIFAAN